MEALQFLKFWKSTAPTKDHRPSSAAATEYYEFTDEEDDSFFELELTAPDLNNTNRLCNGNQSFRCDSDLKFQPQNDKRKILPIESPNSPISILKSAPKFKILMFKKSKSDSALENKVVTVELKLSEAPNLTRDNSLRRHIAEESLSEDSSKNFSKYLKLIKFKAAGKQRESSRFSGGSSAASPSSSPAASSPKKEKPGSFPVVRKYLGKSKSAPCTAAAAVDSPAAESDGIQSAILHCKRSFNSSTSRDSSLLSRFASEPMVVSQRISVENEISVA